MTTLVELCAGTAAVSLRALAGRPVQPITGYMGGKRRWATLLCEALGVAEQVPDRVVLVDAGPWGDAWTVLRTQAGRAGVAALLEAWSSEDPHALWSRLVAMAPPGDAGERVAQFLWLQARSAGTIPIWWSPERGRWESPTGARTETAHQRGGAALASREAGGPGRKRDEKIGRAAQKGSREIGRAYEAGGLARFRDEGSRKLGPANPKESCDASKRQKQKGCRGVQYPTTLARRIRALDALPWDRVEVIHGDVRSVAPIPGSRVFFDPPYLGCPRYAELLPRADVLDVARAHATGGGVVLVSEAEPLPLVGWHAGALPGGRREWVTASVPVRFGEQLALFVEAA